MIASPHAGLFALANQCGAGQSHAQQQRRSRLRHRISPGRERNLRIGHQPGQSVSAIDCREIRCGAVAGAEKQSMIPSARQNYLAEVVASVRHYKADVRERAEVASVNIANVDAPGYRAQRADFSSAIGLLQQAVAEPSMEGNRLHDVSMTSLKASQYY